MTDEVVEAPPKDQAARNKGGRPPALIEDDATVRQIRGLGKLQCTTKEAAAFLGVAENTFLSFLKHSDRARDAFDVGKGVLKVSLRRAQIRTALRGNTTMLIFLGKNLLGQKDQTEHAHTGSLDLGGASARLDAKLAPVLGLPAPRGTQGDPERFDA